MLIRVESITNYKLTLHSLVKEERGINFQFLCHTGKAKTLQLLKTQWTLLLQIMREVQADWKKGSTIKLSLEDIHTSWM